MPPNGNKVAVATNGKQTQSISNGEVKCKNSYYDKQSGSYGRVTTKNSVSSGDYINRGRTGHKDEYKSDSTVRIGDKRGYTEYSRHEKLTRVEYGRDSNNYGGNKVCGGSSCYSSDDGCGADSNNDYDSDDDAYSDGVDFDDDDAACSDGNSDGVDVDDDGGCSDDCYGSDDDDGGCSDCYYDSDD